MHIQESGEMYLETIHILSRKKGEVRSIDVCEYMGYSKPSVSVAMKNLREMVYITTDSNGFISLTETGRNRAEDVLEKHTILSDWLISIGVEASIAREDACRMEHDISAETFCAIKAHIKALSDNETTG